MNLDNRWKQRLSNFNVALLELKKAVELANTRSLTSLEEQGLIHAFEYNYELAWNTIKDFYQTQGETNIQGSRDAIRLSFKRGLITDGKLWMQMIESRILTSHTYNQDTASKIVSLILNSYYPALRDLNNVFNKLQGV